MGMELTIAFRTSSPAWPAVRDRLAQRGLSFQILMIDGELAFPDEHPPDPWHELRLKTPHGMITARREPHRIVLVTWGNADPALLEQRNVLAQVFAECGDGFVEDAAS